MKKFGIVIIPILTFALGISLTFIWLNRDSLFNPNIKDSANSIPAPTTNPAVSPIPSATSAPTATQAPSSNPSLNWKSYTNTKYSYRLKYDPGWFFNDAVNGKKDDSIVLQGNISQKGWPNISINLQTISGNPQDLDTLKTTLAGMFSDYTYTKTTFGKNNIPAVKEYAPGSPQAYSQTSYYFFRNGNVLKLTMMDTDNASSQATYNLFVSNFETF